MSATDRSSIQLLPDHVVNTIAAGEVIERPASVVKELVENAYDAGATRVSVTLRGGGAERIEVLDNGHGFDPTEFTLAFTRHATSKIRIADDLLSLGTFGFRGEALASIAAVSEVVLTTRPRGAATGYRIRCRFGVLEEFEEVGAAPGSHFVITSLFGQTPARRAFLKSTPTEQKHCVDACLRLAMCDPARGLRVEAGDRVLVDLPEQGTDLSKAKEALARFKGELFRFRSTTETMAAEGFLARGRDGTANPKSLWTYVNRRFVRDKVVHRAVVDAYAGQLDPGRHPICLIWVEVPTAGVDVNVHPQKTEVRHQNSSEVYRMVHHAVSDALSTMGASNLSSSPSFARPTGGKGWDSFSLKAAPRGVYASRALESTADESHFSAPTSATGHHGVWFQNYVVISHAHALLLIDVHQLWSRQVLGELTRALASGSIESEALLLPQTLGTLQESSEPSLRRAGIAVESVGPDTYCLTEVPRALVDCDSDELARGILKHVETLRSDPGEGWRQILGCVTSPWVRDRDVAQAERLVDEPGMAEVARTLSPGDLKQLISRPG